MDTMTVLSFSSNIALGFIIMQILILVGVLFAIASGVVCMVKSMEKGYRYPALWLLFGISLNIIALIVCIMLKDKTKAQPVQPDTQNTDI